LALGGVPLPAVNACLNSLSAVLIVTGLILIKTGRDRAHRVVMGAALASSTLFLISYLTYHYTAGRTLFWGTGAIRTAYLLILLTHTVLAVVIVPLVLTTVIHALRGRFDKHKRWARWTWPVWLYVSVTGVAVYWMLYRMNPALPARG
jgi:uncharacterized membrane protein YozB (DUF420 family)